MPTYPVYNRELIKQLREQGMKYKDIALQTGCTISYARGICRGHVIPAKEKEHWKHVERMARHELAMRS